MIFILLKRKKLLIEIKWLIKFLKIYFINQENNVSNFFFSIITVVLNSRNDLIETIKSLKDQKNKNFQYIVIDGGSTDGTIEILKE